MQTFMPYPSFRKSAESLDNKRLNKQIVECYQILKALNGETKGWRNHPATLMWKGYEQALISYAIWCCWTWKDRGYKESKLEIEFKNRIIDGQLEMPWWYGLNSFHESHRSNLNRKNSDYYKSFDLGFVKGLPYCWPVEIDNVKYLRYKSVGDKKYRVEVYK